MIKLKNISLVLATILLFSSFTVGLSSCKKKETVVKDYIYVDEKDKYEAKVDTSFGKSIADEIISNKDYQGTDLGDRQTGSEAEHNTAKYLQKKMKEIGLTDVTLDKVAVDKFEPKGAFIEIGGQKIVLHSYQTKGTEKGGVDAEVVYMGKGTASDYIDGKGKEIDVKGKIVLIDIDQRADWWIGTPVYQAKEKGAIAVLANNTDGFSEVSDEAYNANDLCGSDDIPACSITRKDAKFVKEQIEDEKADAHLEVNNEVEKGKGVSYNVVGKIEGQDSSEQVLFGAHYDAYFEGFNDDEIAAGGVLTIAKAMIESKVEFKRDMVFILHGAEEWGTWDTSYDWAVGSWGQITQVHPEWATKTAAFINFELPAYEFGTTTYTMSAPESYKLIRGFTKGKSGKNKYAPDPKDYGIYEKGIDLSGYQTYTYSDDFSYYAAGVPTFIQGFLKNPKSKDDDVWKFYKKYYHTNFDTEKEYNEKVFEWMLKYYGDLGIYIDDLPIIQLDFTEQYERIKNTLDEKIMKNKKIFYDTSKLDYQLETLKGKTEALYRNIQNANYNYNSLDTSEETKNAIWQNSMKYNKKLYAIFKQFNDAFVMLSAEEPIVGHEWYQNNINIIDKILPLLKKGDYETAYYDYAWQVNAGTDWYYQNFTEKTADYQVLSYQGKYATQNWAEGKVLEFAETRSPLLRIKKIIDGEADKYLDTIISEYDRAKLLQLAKLNTLYEEEALTIEGLIKQIIDATGTETAVLPDVNYD